MTYNEIYKSRINSVNKYSTIALKKMRFCLISNKHNGGGLAGNVILKKGEVESIKKEYFL